MRVRLTGILLAAVVSVAPRVAVALDAPHDKDLGNNACYYCHTLTVASPTGGFDFSAQCLSCHIGAGNRMAVRWTAANEAVPGTSGNSHAWSKPAVSPQYGADSKYIPYPASSKVVDGKLQCALCHDAHSATVPVDPKSMYVSIVGTTTAGTFVGSAAKSGYATVDTGSATMTLTVTQGATPRGFRLRIVSLGADRGTFIISHDYGWSADRWMNWDPAKSAWVLGTAAGLGREFIFGSDVDLDTAGSKVRWTSGAVVGDYWDFYIGYPLLRLSNVSDVGCVICHREREMNHVRARGDDRSYLPNGVRKFSHPVGVGLNANGLGSDRTVVLDADGTAGGSTADGEGGVKNATNDLVLMTGGVVGCTTCHAVHNADSNSLTVDEQ